MILCLLLYVWIQVCEEMHWKDHAALVFVQDIQKETEDRLI